MNPIKFVTNSLTPAFAPGERGHAPNMRESMLFRLAVTQEAVEYALSSRQGHETSVAAQIIRSEVELEAAPQSPAIITQLQPATPAESYTATEAARRAVDDAWAA